MTRILLTGTNGQLGYELEKSLQPLGEVIGVNRDRLDLSQLDQLPQFISDLQPDLIVNAAAYTAVDRAEEEVDTAMAVNGEAPRTMAEGVQQIGAILVHFSTNYVFDGTKNTPYLEQDRPHPMSIYGQSKRFGEIGVQQRCDRHIIIRTAWVYGTGGKENFVKTMLRLGTERDEISVVADQVGTPTWSRDIAQATTQLLQQILAPVTEASLPFGTYHFTNSGVTSWYDFAVAIFEEAENLGMSFKVQRIVPITTPEYPTLAQRPAYSALSNRKMSSVLGTYPPHWRKSLRKMLVELHHPNAH